ncbi:hypothetical protein C464_06070 [Halorubrum coriense DSM 10284]|uniref:Uncharacterized protein n=1 Tax=Halorubrum coriense DSM 10284 TaxID=1227466 RepID=M0ERA5_9EURY|nr:hypothetical protein [Halorubrum coriense]ELZ48954.1 hypothetical protein C464_06070 [Halorubrum coriense DSM 10284]QRG24156.1 hypothetical protein HrrHm1_225 [Halorubrum virus Humcor1]
MPGDDRTVELTLESYETRGEDFESDVETEWKVDAPGLDHPCAGETPEEALRVLAGSLENEIGEFADIDELLEAEVEEDEWEVA